MIEAVSVMGSDAPRMMQREFAPADGRSRPDISNSRMATATSRGISSSVERSRSFARAIFEAVPWMSSRGGGATRPIRAGLPIDGRQSDGHEP